VVRATPNWEEVWDSQMVVRTTSGKEWELEYVWEPAFTKRFIRELLDNQKKEILQEVKNIIVEYSPITAQEAKDLSDKIKKLL
jgi:hypothetical protein